MDLLIDVISYGDFDKLEDQVRDKLKKTLQYLDKSDVLVEVALVSDKEMIQISKKTRGKEILTTVLSFENNNFPQQLDNGLLRLGEIYLAPQCIKSKNMNLIKVAIHGLLHLVGYTHKSESDTIKMEVLEDKIFKYLKLDK